MNNGQLKAELVTFSKRDDLTSRASTYVARAEDMIAAKARTLEMVTYADLLEASRIAGGRYTLPANYLRLVSCFGTQGGTQYKVKTVSTDELRRYNVGGVPAFAAVYGRTIEFRGAPPTDSTFNLLYFAKPATLSADGDTTDLLTAAPQLYLHGALHWLHLEAQDIDMATAHLDLFTRMVEELNLAADQAMRAGATSLNESAATFGSAM